MSALHTKKDNLTCIASKDNQKAEVLADFFSSVFTSETDSNIPELENLSSRDTNSVEIIAIFQSSGTIPVVNELSNIIHNGLSIT
jgi:hypothetical protein